MTQTDKQSIVEYLSGPRCYSDGVALYQRYGLNLRLKRQFAVDETAATREILLDELRKLAGLTEAEFARLPRLAKVPTLNVSATSVPALMAPDSIESQYQEVSEPVRKMIRFREKYPFLNYPDCPDILKVLVADMFTAYGNYKAAFARLQATGDADAATVASDCEMVISEYLKNREIWEELEYYRDHGTVLGKAAKFREIAAAEDLSAMSDVDLISKLQSAQTQESKQKKKVAESNAKGNENEKAAASLEYWSARKRELKAELSRRKKK